MALVEDSFVLEKEIALRVAPSWLYCLTIALVLATRLSLKQVGPGTIRERCEILLFADSNLEILQRSYSSLATIIDTLNNLIRIVGISLLDTNCSKCRERR